MNIPSTIWLVGTLLCFALSPGLFAVAYSLLMLLHKTRMGTQCLRWLRCAAGNVQNHMVPTYH